MSQKIKTKPNSSIIMCYDSIIAVPSNSLFTCSHIVAYLNFPVHDIQDDFVQTKEGLISMSCIYNSLSSDYYYECINSKNKLLHRMSLNQLMSHLIAPIGYIFIVLWCADFEKKEVTFCRDNLKPKCLVASMQLNSTENGNTCSQGYMNNYVIIMRIRLL